MLYYGKDPIFANPSYGFNGVMGSWRLNQLTRGIQDIDIIKQANAINPTATQALVNSMVQDVMYLRGCFDPSDCSYSYGPRPWDQSLNAWELSREAMLQIIAGAPITPSVQTIINGSGKFTGSFTFKLQ